MKSQIRYNYLWARHVKITERFGLVEAKNTQPETLVSWHAGFH